MIEKMLLDGDLVDGRRLSLGATSRGLAFGYGVFETIKFLEGRPCFWAEHVARLIRAVAAAGLATAIDADDLREQARRLLAANAATSGVFKIIVCEDEDGVCRVALFIRNHGFRRPKPSIRLQLSPVVKASQAFTSRHKTLNYMDTARDLRLAQERGFDELVYRNELGALTETSVSNLFFVKDGALKTPALECGLLDGIARGQLLAAAGELGVSVEEGHFRIEDLLAADEVFVSNSAVGALPASEVDAGDRGQENFGVRVSAALGAALLERERRSL